MLLVLIKRGIMYKHSSKTDNDVFKCGSYRPEEEGIDYFQT
jgi:hypothetical protein